MNGLASAEYLYPFICPLSLFVFQKLSEMTEGECLNFKTKLQNYNVLKTQV